MLYRSAKLFHLAGLVLWLGPSTGGYLLILLARSDGGPAIELWLMREYLHLIHIETLGLFMLLASGATMRRAQRGLAGARWLKVKLVIVFLVFIPLEAAQLVIYHMVVKRAFLTGAGVGVEEAFELYWKFSLFAAVVLAVTIPPVFYLAVFRPSLGKAHQGE